MLLRKPRAYAEIYNDLDGDLVNLFTVLRDPERSARLVELVTLTPFARVEFNAAYDPGPDPVERARCLLARSFMGFGSAGTGAHITTGFRASSNRSGTTPAHDWRNFPAGLVQVIERVRGVVIESGDAIGVMARHDGPDTVHYVDPPYLPETRSTKRRANGQGYHIYAHELTVADHAQLLAFLPTLRGGVVLSGYPAAQYDDALPGWRRVECPALADGARPRTEVLWISPAACAALDRHQVPLLAAGVAWPAPVPSRASRAVGAATSGAPHPLPSPVVN